MSQVDKEAAKAASVDVEQLDDSQKRRLRAIRRGYRAEKVEVKDDGWTLEVTFMDGSKAKINSKLLKLKEKELQQVS